MFSILIMMLYSCLAILLFISCKSAEKNSSVVEKSTEVKATLIRQPYLQIVRSNTVTITWKTDVNAKNCHVRFSRARDRKGRIVQGTLVQHEGNSFNEVVINNLEPNTKYQYQIYTNGHPLTQGVGYYFITATNTKNAAFSFYALGDIGAKQNQSFAKASANTIHNLTEKPDFGLGLGDIVYPKGESKNYDMHLFEPFQEVFKNTPFYPVAGNHDWLTAPDLNFEKEWSLPGNEHYYSFAYANAFFIGLDSRDGTFYEIEKQTTWLKNELQKAKGKYDWIIVYLHHNGKTCTYKKDYEHVIALYEIFAKNDVDLVLNGHAHTFERLKPYDANGTVDASRKNQNTYTSADLRDKFISITLGAGGKLNKKWKPNPENDSNCNDGTIVAHFEHVPSFGLFKIANKTLTFQGINSLTGTTFDTFTIQKE